MLLCTQVYLIDGNRVCLPLKKRGFGAGWHNGFGGKVKPGEDPEAGAIRELLEESGVAAKVLSKRAELTFNFLQTGEQIFSHVYWCRDYIGRPQESDEMRPFWFNFNQIPYNKMWPDDIVWFPKFLAGEQLKGEFEFLDDKGTVGKYAVSSAKFN